MGGTVFPPRHGRSPTTRAGLRGVDLGGADVVEVSPPFDRKTRKKAFFFEKKKQKTFMYCKEDL